MGPHTQRQPQIISQTTTIKMAAISTSLLLVSIILAIGLAASANADTSQPMASLQHQEILAQPSSQLRIECKLPLSSGSDYYWNFQGTLSSSPKLLSFGDKLRTSLSNLQLDIENGSYDLIINNITYELNDGIYNCYYKEPSTNQTIERVFRLIVLSK